MATAPIPAIFLSHSGKQKEFARRLHRELIHVNHQSFFDQDRQDSLPSGEPFPSRIVEACLACKLGIVIVSHDFIESLWPMVELNLLLFGKPSSPNINVYPIFYELTPADLTKPENLAKWRHTWETKEPSGHVKVQDLHMVSSSSSTPNIQRMLDVNSWPNALEMLKPQVGDILSDSNKVDGHAFIQTIVRYICNRIPPPNSFLLHDHLKGSERIQQDIDKLFQQEERIDDSARMMPIAVGLYGVGGSGKTTVCKYMLSFYGGKYLGTCGFLQFPSKKEHEHHLLIDSMKEFLSKCGNYSQKSLNKINNVEQAMPHLEGLLKRYRVFLVLDNVWDWALPIAKQIVTMHYLLGSKLLVTARSEHLLRQTLGRVLAMQIVHVPSISEEEAVEALMAYSFTSWQYATNVDLKGLASSCFFDKQCHPLFLEAIGKNLRHRGGHVRNAKDLTQLISRLQARRISHDGIEETVLKVLRTSFDGLYNLKLQETFLSLGSCVPREMNGCLSSTSEWLSMLSGSQTIGDIRAQLVELEYHGLIKIYKGQMVILHDLQRMLIESIVGERNGAPRCFFFEGDVGTLSANESTRYKYVYGTLDHEGAELTTEFRRVEHCFRNCDLFCFPFDLFARSAYTYASPSWPNIEVLHLGGRPCAVRRLSFWRFSFSMKYMQALRCLVLQDLPFLEELGGWDGAPNLVSVEIVVCERLQKMESVACLHKLASLVILGCRRLVIERCSSGGRYVTDFSSCKDLKRLVIKSNDRLAILGHLPAQLQELHLADCRNLVDAGTLCSAVTSLRLWRCYALKEVKLAGDAALKSLEELSIQYSCRLISTTACSPVPTNAFTNLRFHWADGHEWQGGRIFEVRRNLAISLEVLYLHNFETAEEIEGLSALVKLKHLIVASWPSLTKITSLGSLPKLEYLEIYRCGSVREVGHWEAPFSFNLKTVSIEHCGKLESLSTMRHLTSLTSFFMVECPMVQADTLPRGKSSIWNNPFW